MCGAPPQTPTLPAGIDLEKETVIYGVVSNGGVSNGGVSNGGVSDGGSGEAGGAEVGVPGAYVRLLDGTGEFTAEVVTSATGDFRFFAAPGAWTLSVLHRDGKARREVDATGPGLVEASLALQ